MNRMLNIWVWHKCRVEDAIVDVVAILADLIEEEAAQPEEDVAAQGEVDAAAPAKAGAQDAAINVAAVQEKAHAVAPEVDCSIRKIYTESSSEASMIAATSPEDFQALVAAAPAADVTQESQAAQVVEDAITDEASSD